MKINRPKDKFFYKLTQKNGTIRRIVCAFQQKFLFLHGFSKNVQFIVALHLKVVGRLKRF